MNPKIQQLLDKLSFFKKFQWGRGAHFFKKIFLIFGSLALTIVLATVVWFRIHPLASYRDAIQGKLKSFLQADELRIKELHWHFKPTRLSIGLRVEGVVVEGSPVAKRLVAPEITADLEPLKLLLGKIPVHIYASEGEWVFPKPHLEAETPSGLAKGDKMLLQRLLRHLRLKVNLDRFTVVGDPSRFALAESNSLIKANNAEIDATIVGLPGYFDTTVNADMDVVMGGAQFRAKGPLKVSAEGFSQVAQGEVVGVSVDRIDADLSQLFISGLGGNFEKPPGMLLKVRSEGQAILGENSQLKIFELRQGVILLDELKLGFSSTYSSVQQSLSTRWIHTPQEVRELHLPIRGFTDIAVKGMVEIQGNIKTSRDFNFEAGWNLSFNNIHIAPTEMNKVFDSRSKGTLLVSFVSEGSFSKGLIQTPRTELQIDGSGSYLEMWQGKLLKPDGDPVNLLLKATVKNDELSVSHFDANVNNLNLQGGLKLTNFTKYLLGDRASYLSVNFHTNPVNLTRWSSYIPVFRRIPLEGLVQVVGTAEGPLYVGEEAARDISWRIDRIAASKVKGAFDRESLIEVGYKPEDLSLSGPFSLEFLFQGRGKGSVVEQGTLVAQADFNKVYMAYGDFFKKTANVPCSLDIGVDQTTNKLAIRRGSLRLHEMQMSFEGNILNGSKRNWVDVKLEKAIHLDEWRQLFPSLAPDIPLSGDIGLAAKIGFENEDVFEGTLDWRKLSFDGELDVKNLSTKIAKLKNPLVGGNGKLLVSGNVLTVPSFQFKIGSSKANFSLNGRTLSKTSALTAQKMSMAQGNLGWLFGKEPWDLSMVLTTDNFDPGVFALLKVKKGPQFSEENLDQDLETIIRGFLSNPKLVKSQMKLVFSAKQSKKATLASKGADFVVHWDKGILRANPLALNAFGGKLAGSFSFDANPFLAGKEPPLSNFTGTFKGVQVDDVLDFVESKDLAPVTGVAEGSVQLAFQGMSSEEIKKSARGRVTGSLAHGEYAGFSDLKRQVRHFFVESEARDYLMRQANYDKCFDPQFSADFDLNFSEDRVHLGNTDLRYANASKIRISGELDHGLKARLSGDFFAGKECVKGRARNCLEHDQGFVAFPFALTGDLKAPVLTSQIEELIPDFISCMTKKSTERLNAASVDPKILQEDRAAQEKTKKILKGSSR